jgi:hypothetical protein
VRGGAGTSGSGDRHVTKSIGRYRHASSTFTAGQPMRAARLIEAPPVTSSAVR